jgi:CDP-6-deoxy-D-xylo-4-hexulose-3-dehydrase
MKDWKSLFVEEWRRRAEVSAKSPYFFPLIEQTFTQEDVLAMADVLLSGRLTMADNVRCFETMFAEYIGAPHAVMVNSGSSANLLAMTALTNQMRERRLEAGDEVLVPAVCWSTSIWPIFQCGLKPVFVDVDPHTLNVDLNQLQAQITSRTRGFMAVHILGNSAPLKELNEIVEKNRLLWIEDTCESLGTRAMGRRLGSFADFGTYSFYYSHHITTGEGGMVVCKTKEDADLLRCLRAHGWSRALSNHVEFEKAHHDIDPRFLFVNVGFNFRPIEVQAALGISQLKRINEMNQTRVANHSAVIRAVRESARWKGQFEFIEAASGTEPVWFGFCCLLSEKIKTSLNEFLAYLTAHGVDNRPIVSGNWARQPALKHFDVNLQPEQFKGAEAIHQRGFFIGLHNERLSQETNCRLAETLLGFEFQGM